MPSKEVTRLSRLKIDTMPTARLRAELGKVRQNVAKEIEQRDKAAQQQQKQLNNLTRALDAEGKKTQELKSENETLKGQVKSLEGQLKDVVKPRGGVSSEIKLDAVTKGRIELLEGEKVSLAAQLNSTKLLLDKLQAEQAETNSSVRTLSTDQIMKKFSEDITAANRVEESDFEIDSVEVDVRGALGEESGKVVMGFDAKRQADPEASTRLKFTLKPRVQTRLLDNE